MNTFVADPHWGWWIVWYFYLGGIAAGAYFLAALVEFVSDEQDRRVSRIGYLLAAPLVAVCGVLLILDLDQPLRFWHMLSDAESFSPHVKYWSPMSIGAWALLVFGTMSTISFVAALAEAGWCGLGRWSRVAKRLHHGLFGRTFDLIGTVCGFFIASYTGALLTATNQPIWSDNPWIATMFLASSATSGAATIRLLAELSGRAEALSLAKLDRVDASALVLELGAISLFLASQRSASLPILELPPIWWLLLGTLGLGVFAPLLLHMRPMLVGRRTPMISAMLVLVGGFVLRYAVLAVVPAVLDRPREVELTVSSPAPSRSRAGADAANDVWVLMRDRLELMEAVALAKWHAGSPIEDPAREQALLDSARAWAEKRHVQPRAVESFLRAQIEAAKQVQWTCFADWQDRPPAGDDAPNLTDDLRPRLDDITDRLLDAFVRCRPTLQDERIRDALADRMHAELEGTRLGLAERRELLDNVLRAARIVSTE